MTQHRLSATLLLTTLLTPACVQGRDLLEPVAQARGELVADEARPAAMAAVGMAAVGAALCGYSLEDWQGMGGTAPALPTELAAWFSLEDPGVMRAYPARGQYELTWGGGAFFGQAVALKATVATPMSAFTVYVDQAADAAQDDTGPADTGLGHDDSLTLASAALSTSSCSGEFPQVTGSLSFPVSGEYSWAVGLNGAEDDEGVAFAQGALLPSRGDLSWSGIASFGRATLQTDDASTITDNAWPSTASGRGWEASVDLELIPGE